jgi:hypothetical protein
VEAYDLTPHSQEPTARPCSGSRPYTIYLTQILRFRDILKATHGFKETLCARQSGVRCLYYKRNSHSFRKVGALKMIEIRALRGNLTNARLQGEGRRV